MQIIRYKDTSIPAYLMHMRESAEMINKIALDAENAFWDTLKAQVKLQNFTDDPYEIAKEINDTLSYHLNNFMRNFSVVAGEEYSDIDFSDGVFPFYVRRSFSSVSASAEPEPVIGGSHVKGYMNYIPFGEVLIKNLFSVTDSAAKWLQNYDARASESLHGESVEKMYNSLYTIMNNYVSTTFPAVITPMYITNTTPGPDSFPDQENVFSAKFHGFDKDSDYTGRITFQNAGNKLGNFSETWIYAEKFESDNPAADFFDEAMFVTSEITNETYADIIVRAGSDTSFDGFFDENLDKKEIESYKSRNPGESYVFRKVKNDD